MTPAALTDLRVALSDAITNAVIQAGGDHDAGRVEVDALAWVFKLRRCESGATELSMHFALGRGWARATAHRRPNARRPPGSTAGVFGRSARG